MNNISILEQQIKFILPEDYLSIARWEDSTDLEYDVSYLSLFPICELTKINEDYEVDKYASAYLIIGTNGGGTGVFYHRDSNMLYSMPVVGMDAEDALQLGDNLSDVLTSLKNGSIAIY